MKKIVCMLCGTEISAYQCQSHKCPHCTAIITTDRSANVSSVRLSVGTLLSELKSLTSRGQRAEAEELLEKLQGKTLAVLTLSKILAPLASPESSLIYEMEDNYRVIEKVREQFREWVIG